MSSSRKIRSGPVLFFQAGRSSAASARSSGREFTAQVQGSVVQSPHYNFFLCRTPLFPSKKLPKIPSMFSLKHPSSIVITYCSISCSSKPFRILHLLFIYLFPISDAFYSILSLSLSLSLCPPPAVLRAGTDRSQSTSLAVSHS